VEAVAYNEWEKEEKAKGKKKTGGKSQGKCDRTRSEHFGVVGGSIKRACIGESSQNDAAFQKKLGLGRGGARRAGIGPAKSGNGGHEGLRKRVSWFV